MTASRVRLTAAALAVAVLPVVGCDASAPAARPGASPSAAPEAAETPGPGDHRLSAQWQGRSRSFTVHAPPAYDGSRPLPLVVVMHAYPGDGREVAATSGMNAKADREGFLVLYPDGWAGGMNALICCGAEDDVGLIRDLVARMVARWHADPRRVYATGISNGADMSFKVAVELSDVFAAVAPVSGGLGGRALADPAYRPARPVSVLTFIGGQDRYHHQFTAGLDAWRARLSCAAHPTARPRQYAGIRHTLDRCGDGSTLDVYDIAAMGHRWPGDADGGMTDPNAGVDATDLMWAFFREHTRA